jgi:hypothetical protein
MVYFGAGGLQHSTGLLMLVTYRSDIGTNPEFEEKKVHGKNVDFLNKNFNVQIIDKLHDIQ